MATIDRVIPRKGQPRIQKMKNYLWYCVIFHIKEKKLEFNMQNSLALYALWKSYEGLKLSD